MLDHSLPYTMAMNMVSNQYLYWSHLRSTKVPMLLNAYTSKGVWGPESNLTVSVGIFSRITSKKRSLSSTPSPKNKPLIETPWIFLLKTESIWFKNLFSSLLTLMLPNTTLMHYSINRNNPYALVVFISKPLSIHFSVLTKDWLPLRTPTLKFTYTIITNWSPHTSSGKQVKLFGLRTFM